MSDESLIKISDLIGKTIGNAVGGKLGTIREVYIDRETGAARFAIIDTGGLFGVGGKFHPIPWRLLRFDPGTGVYATSLTKERIHAAPAYDRDQLSSASYGWSEQTARYFDAL
ncbi:PRC-barrel domain-containing protein [Phenylobacterium sp.]|jgi:sporulation protein YlmC with PRC-barrel domain|uniref:PRC-barrel domain-containing protein n=1 Tax=Phenylobacterium sp. TaxID=1871053 RepID=UPI002E360A52|nr:PRC-barrel domain-containing protein [Phenylobacterium sp.]HEX4710589.1 PRC-barrel domain-containing protein [Phenylobacterium sp.]